MRLYKNFSEAVSEIRRDVKEMGITVHTRTYQNKYISDDDNFESLELQDYVYSVTGGHKSELNPTQPWADFEFAERIGEAPVNPGEAWKTRSEVWDQFINVEGKFDYTYSQRMGPRIFSLVHTLSLDPSTRQAFLSVWEPDDLGRAGGSVRIPCTLGYQFQHRNGALNITYLQRSADVATHFQNDIWMARSLQEFIAGALGWEIGRYTHWIGSLHVFKKDVADVF